MELKSALVEMQAVKADFAAASHEQRLEALAGLKALLLEKKSAVFAANAKDLAAAAEAGLPETTQARLKFDEHKLEDSISQLESLLGLGDPLGKVLLKRELDEGLILERVTVPLGVIGVIFEARPDALIQIASLCIKSGNCAVLKGGKETTHTNRALFALVKEAIVAAGLPAAALLQVETHAEIDELLGCTGLIDLLVPRGSNKFVQYIMDHTQIPVMGHSSGVCHAYVSSKADIDLALKLIVDAKTQYPVACNALETVLVEAPIAKTFIPRLEKSLQEAGVTIHPSAAALSYLSQAADTVSDFSVEYGSFDLTLHLVDDLSAAISHINRYGSHHTDLIITEDSAEAARFMQLVDSAGVYHNCSTRFADGFRYGFGAELGISTGKLHARGPVGLEGLVTYKYLLHGAGHIVDDYATHKRSFTHKDLSI